MLYRKILFFIKNLKKINFNLNKKKIIIFDGLSISDLKYTMELYDYFILEDRINRINIIYINPLIIYYFIFYFFLIFKNYSIKVIYTIALIRSIKPNVVITSIDNSINFFLCAKILSKKIYFLVVQNDSESAFKEMGYGIKNNIIYPKNYKKLFFIPNFICFGQNEKDGAIKEGLKINTFYKYGSIRVANFFYHIKKNNIKLNKNLFDICFISEERSNQNNLFNHNFIEQGAINVLKFTIKFAIQNNLKFIFANKYFQDTNEFKSEIDFYSSQLNKEELEFLITNINKKKDSYSSQLASLQSLVSVGTQSTMLYEKIGLNEKILSCNFSGFSLFDFPVTGICSMNENNYDDFSARLKLILGSKSNEYFQALDRNPKYVMEFDNKESVIQKTRKIVEKYL